jgi:hypothetical protein
MNRKQQQKAQSVKTDKKSSLKSGTQASVTSTENDQKGWFNFSKRDFWLIGCGSILGLILGVILLQRGAELCEVNIGPLKFALPCSSTAAEIPHTCADYGIKITSPQTGTKAWDAIMVTGTYVNEPPDDSVLLLLKSPAPDYFPQRMVVLDRAQRTWQGEVNLGNDPRRDFVITVSTIGNNGRALFDYFTKVGNELGGWPAIVKLTDDMVECDRVAIIHER